MRASSPSSVSSSPRMVLCCVKRYLAPWATVIVTPWYFKKSPLTNLVFALISLLLLDGCRLYGLAVPRA